MKKKRYTFYSIAALLMLLFTSMPSCSTEDVPMAEEGKGIILVSLNNTQLRAGNLYTDDALIQKVRILVFLNGLIEKNELFVSGENEFNNPFTIEVLAGTKEVHVVANETSGLTSQLAAVSSVNALKELLAETINTPLALPLVMTGETSSVHVTKTDPHTNTTITLERIAAKIKLQFKKETDADVKITKVALLRNAGKSSLISGGTTIADQSYWNHELSGLDISLGTGVVSVPGSETIYVYENLSGGNKTNATRLEIEAIYNGAPTKYRVYINENLSSLVNPGDPNSSVTNPNDHLYVIKRNYAYELTGTIKNMGEIDGLILTTNVRPWEKVSSSILFDWVFEISPYPTPNDKTYTVNSPADEIRFTFKLTNPIDAVWIANLTNPDFTITNHRGETDETVTIIIKAKNAQSTTERTAEFYIITNYGGSSSEIPLLNGTTSVGNGNRIIIRQPAIN